MVENSTVLFWREQYTRFYERGGGRTNRVVNFKIAASRLTAFLFTLSANLGNHACLTKESKPVKVIFALFAGDYLSDQWMNRCLASPLPDRSGHNESSSFKVYRSNLMLDGLFCSCEECHAVRFFVVLVWECVDGLFPRAQG